MSNTEKSLDWVVENRKLLCDLIELEGFEKSYGKLHGVTFSSRKSHVTRKPTNVLTLIFDRVMVELDQDSIKAVNGGIASVYVGSRPIIKLERKTGTPKTP